MLWPLFMFLVLRPPANLTMCSTPDSLLQNVRYSLHPDPPTKGQSLNMAFSGELSERIEFGTIKIHVVLNNFLTVYSSTLDLCDSLKDTGLSCPLEPGHIEVAATADIPSLVPPGEYTIDLQIQGEKPITCIGAKIRL